MRKILILIISIATFNSDLVAIKTAFAASDLSERLAGRILLEVEARGEAWYVNPADLKRYYLGRPDDAFNVMSKLSVGITNNDLAKIPIGLLEDNAADDDNDGLGNDLEKSLGTDQAKADTDSDGYADKEEIENNYAPLESGRLVVDENLVKKNLGKIFLQVERAGEAWYLEPTTRKRYFLGRPANAFEAMKKFGLGVTESDISQITAGSLAVASTGANTANDGQNNGNSGDAENVIDEAADAIRSGDKEKAISYFTPTMQKAIEYTIDFLDKDGRLTLANILSGSKLKNSSADEKLYTNDVYFSLGGYDVTVKFYVKKQSDGNWLLANL